MKRLLLIFTIILSPYFLNAQNTSFVTTWRTTAVNESITIPTTGVGYNYDVDWGDGNTTSGETGNATHNYAVAGDYEVAITGDFPRIYFNNVGDKEKILSIEQWGDISWVSMNHAFWGCTNLVENAIDAPDLSIVTDISRMFMDTSSFNQDISNWVVGNSVTNMVSTFQNATAFNQDLNNWDVSNVTNMNASFAGATNFNGDISSWNVGNVSNMIATFSDASSFNQDIGGWNVVNVLYMNFMFSGASSFNQDIGAWDVSNVITMANMFNGVTLSTENYENLLFGWSGQTLQQGVDFHAGNSKYCSIEAEVAIATLLGDFGWSITDGGKCEETVAIPDANFELALIEQGLDTNGEAGTIFKYEAEAVTFIDITDRGVNNLIGIEAFINLEGIEADLNNIATVNLEFNTKLTQLHLNENELNDVDLSNNLLLEGVGLNSNNLTEIDLSAQSNLNLVAFGGNTDLTTLNLRNGNNTNMTVFVQYDLPSLKCITADDVISQVMTDSGLSFSSDCTETILIPDPNFELALIEQGLDTNGEAGTMFRYEAEAITTLDVSSRGITNFTGIEAFTGLVNLYAWENGIEALNVSQMPLLEHLSISDNNISELDLTNNSKLREVYFHNNAMTIFALGNHPDLEQVHGGTNQITEINLANSPNLASLHIYTNELTNLDVSSNGELIELHCSDNKLSTLDVSNNPELEFLHCSDNLLVNLNIANGNNANFLFPDWATEPFNATGNPALTCIQVDVAIIDDIPGEWAIDELANYSTNCPIINCDDLIEIPDANFEQALIDLGYDTNGLTGNILRCDAISIVDLDLSDKGISSLLGIEQFDNLTYLYCHNNSLTEINLGNNSNIINLHCGANLITDIDLSNLPNLTSLHIQENKLTSLDVRLNKALVELFAWDNDIQALDVTQMPLLEHLSISDNYITELDLTNNSKLRHFSCHSNLLIEINLGFNSNLINLDCSNNLITTIDLSNYPNLASLFINNNDLVTLDVSSNIELLELYCDDTKLRTLDVSNNPKLERLHCVNNSLINLNIANGNNAKFKKPEWTTTSFIAENNPALTCIQVDADVIDNIPVDWAIDPSANYNTNCPIINCDDLIEITDDNFEQALIDLGYDTNGLTGNILRCDALGIYSLDIVGKGINDLTGIEEFTTLNTLFANNNNITNLQMGNHPDLHGIWINNNALIDINILNCPSMEYLHIASNQLETIDLSGNPDLLELSITSNNLLSLDVSNNPNLFFLRANDNDLHSVNIANENNLNMVGVEWWSYPFDVRNNPNLVCIQVDAGLVNNIPSDWAKDASAYYSENGCNDLIAIPDLNFEQVLISLGIDTNGETGDVLKADIYGLNELDVSGKGIESLSGLEYFENLEIFNANQNQVSNIPLSPNAPLKELRVNYNQINSLNLTPYIQLEILEFEGNQLASIDISNNTQLSVISCAANQLSDLDLSNHTNLSTLFCSSNQFENLEVSRNINLQVLDCANNQLTSLDVSNNEVLATLDCSSNQLTGLNVSTNAMLTGLLANDNELVYLNMKNGNNINVLDPLLFNVSNNNLNCIEADGTSINEISQVMLDSGESFSADCETVYIPDSNFELALIELGIDLEGQLDHVILKSEAEAVLSLDVQSKGISSLTGIEYFTALTDLKCSSNQLTSLDISNNVALIELRCAINQLTSLDVSNNTNLTRIGCSWNELTHLDISNNLNLSILDCQSNLMTSLDVSKNLALTRLFCQNNLLTGLNVSKNSLIERILVENNELIYLNIKNGNNSSITNANWFNAEGNNLTCIEADTGFASLNIDEGVLFNEDCGTVYIPDPNFEQVLIDLEIDTDGVQNHLISRTDAENTSEINASFPKRLNFQGNEINNWQADSRVTITERIKDVTGIEAFTALTKLQLGYNEVTKIDVSNNLALVDLDVRNNAINTIDISQNVNLNTLNCMYNQITNLNVSENTGLLNLICRNNQLVDLDVTHNTNLRILNCIDNQLASLDVSNNTKLTNLSFGINQISNIDVSNNIGLIVLGCGENQLTSLDVSNNTSLARLTCYGNQLTTLDVSVNTSLTHLWLYDNQLTGLDVSKNSLLNFVRVENNQLVYLNIKNGNNVNITNANWFNATGNNLSCIEADAGFTNPNIDEGVSFSEDCGTVYIPDPNFENYLETHNADGNEVAIGDPTSMGDGIANNNLTLTSKVDQVSYLNVGGKNISNLTGIEAFVNLVDLRLFNNLVESIDLSNNLNLTKLVIARNLIKVLDISNNTQLFHLNAHRTWNLKELIVSEQNTELAEVSLWESAVERLDLSKNPITKLWIANNPNISYLDLRNGNNLNVSAFWVDNTPRLYCVSADGTTDGELSGVMLNTGKSFNEDCDKLTIPDVNFETYLETHNANGDVVPLRHEASMGDGILDNNTVLVSKINTVTNLDIANNEIADLTGIEKFYSLESLIVSGNVLVNLDLGENLKLKNLECSDNQLTSIVLGLNTELQVLNCANNFVTNLNLSPNTGLSYIDVSNNNLERLIIANGNNVNMHLEGGTSFNAVGNNNLTCIQVDADVLGSIPTSWSKDETASYGVECTYNSDIVFIPDPNFEQALIDLDMDGTVGDARDGMILRSDAEQITWLHLMNPRFVPAWLKGNSNSSMVNVSGKIKDLTGIESFINLEYIYAAYNAVESASFNSNASLIDLDLGNNGLQTVDFSQNLNLTSLVLLNNQLTSLDLSENPVLEFVQLNNNNLTSLNIANGNNANFIISHDWATSSMNTSGNPNLNCITVDSEIVDNIPVDWMKDDVANYNISCDNDLETLAGSWKVAPAANSLVVGPANDRSRYWWANDAQYVSNWACYFDDEYVFNTDGSFQNVLGSETLIDFWQGNYGCGSPISPHDGTVDANYVYNQNTGTITLNGIGAYLVLPKANNQGELPSVPVPSTIVHNATLSDNNNVMTIELFVGSGTVWTYKLISDRVVYIPDTNFETYLETHNAEGIEVVLGDPTSMGDGILDNNLTLKSKVKTVENLYVSDLEIADLTGIEAFVNLIGLYPYNNQLTTLDVSNNLLLEELLLNDNQVSSLDLSSNILLKGLNVDRNQMNNLVLGTHPDLSYILASGNQLGNINVSSSPKLKVLSVGGGNQISNLDLSGNPLLEEIDVNGNLLTELDISSNPNVFYLICDGNQLTSLNIANENNLNFTNPSHIQWIEYAFSARGNLDLECIQVDPEIVHNVPADWAKDGMVIYTSDCATKPEYVYVPDAKFERALIDLGIDSDEEENTWLLKSDAIGINSLDISDPENNENLPNVYEKIQDLTGIEAFVNLNQLFFSNNAVSSVDLSSLTELTGLWCAYNSLSSLDVNYNTKLQDLSCGVNNISSLDLTYNLDLRSIYCNVNPLISLDVSKNIELFELICDNAQLTEIDLSKNFNLKSLLIHNNNLTSLDVSSNPILQTLHCSDNALISLNIANGNNDNFIPDYFTWMTGSFNSTNNLDLECIQVDSGSIVLSTPSDWFKDAKTLYSSDCATKPEHVYIPDENFEQALIDLDIDKDQTINSYILKVDAEAVIDLNVEDNSIADLTGIEGFINLRSLNVKNNQLSSIYVSNNLALTDLNCNNNLLTSLDVTANENLAVLSCFQNQITNLNINGLEQLSELDCSSNQLVDLNVSTNVALTDLRCNSNQLTQLILSANSNLLTVLCRNNKLSQLDISPLPIINWVDAQGNMGLKLLTTAITGSPTLKLLHLGSTGLASFNPTLYPNIESLILSKNNLTRFNTTNIPNIKTLYLDENAIEKLDLSSNSSLFNLYAVDNQLVELNVNNGNNDILTAFNVQNNNLLCITVDNIDDANNGLFPYDTWFKDVGVNYSLDCKGEPEVILIPDANFEAVLLAGDNPIDTDGELNGRILKSDAEATTILDASNSLIEDLTGIEGFVNLTTLDVSGNALPTINLMESTSLIDLNVSGNNLTSLFVNSGRDLISLNCSDNELTSLNFSDLTDLEYFDASINNFQSFDASSHDLLVSFDVSNNLLTELDMRNGNNPAIEYFDAGENEDLECVGVDDVGASEANVNWHIDLSSTIYSASGDCTGPTIITQNITVELDVNGLASIDPADIDNGTTDNTTVSGKITFDLDITDFDCSNVGLENSVLLTATDEFGNSSSANAIVTVVDVIPPIVSAVRNIELDLNGGTSVGLFPQDIDDGSSDNCGVSDWSLDQDYFSFPGTYTVILTATDASGNSSTDETVVEVVDSQSTPTELKFKKNVVATIFPVPFTTEIKIAFSKPVDDLNSIVVELLTNSGGATGVGFTSVGENYVSTSTANLSAGTTYILQVSVGSETKTTQIIKDEQQN